MKTITITLTEENYRSLTCTLYHRIGELYSAATHGDELAYSGMEEIMSLMFQIENRYRDYDKWKGIMNNE